MSANISSPDSIAALFHLSDRQLRSAELRIEEAIAAFRHRADVVGQFFAPDTSLGYQSADSPIEPMALDDYLDAELSALSAGSPNTSNPRCLGHMSGLLPDFIKPLSSLLVSLNQNLVKRDASRVMTLLERQTMAVLHRAIYRRDKKFYRRHAQDPESTLGLVTSGGTLSNLTALWCARNARFGATPGFDGIENVGCAEALQHHGYRGAVVFCSELAHYSIAKAMDLLGFGQRSVIAVPLDNHGRIDTSACADSIARCRSERLCPMAIVGIAGTTDCGSIDPLDELAELAKAEQVHFHVDAAWGAPMLLSHRHRGRLRGVEAADTVTIDGHKQLCLPLGTSALLVQDPELAKVIEHRAEYMLQNGSGDLGRRSLEGSRPGSVLYLHALLHLFGSDGIAQVLKSTLRVASEMAALISDSPDFELLLYPEANIVLYRYLPKTAGESMRQYEQNDDINSFNRRLQLAQAKRGRTFVSRTQLKLPQLGSGDVTALRAVLANPFTSISDLKAVLDDQRDIAAGLEPDCSPDGVNLQHFVRSPC